MAKPKNVQHTIRGFWMSRAYAEQVMRDHCTITWDDQGGIRDTTDDERVQMRAAQAKLGGIPDSGAMTCRKCNATNVKTPKNGLCTVCASRAFLANSEIPGLTCTIRPNYRLIRDARMFCAEAA